MLSKEISIQQCVYLQPKAASLSCRQILAMLICRACFGHRISVSRVPTVLLSCAANKDVIDSVPCPPLSRITTHTAASVVAGCRWRVSLQGVAENFKTKRLVRSITSYRVIFSRSRLTSWSSMKMSGKRALHKQQRRRGPNRSRS